MKKNLVITKMSKKKKRIKRNLGDIVSIQIENNTYCFARVLHSAIFAFYDLKSETENIGLETIISSDILFKVPVMDYALKNELWKIIGFLPLENDLQKSINFFRQDDISNKLYIYNSLSTVEKKATKDECQGLECAAVWDPEHVEGRLRDHYANVPNKWTESLQIK